MTILSSTKFQGWNKFAEMRTLSNNGVQDVINRSCFHGSESLFCLLENSLVFDHDRPVHHEVAGCQLFRANRTRSPCAYVHHERRGDFIHNSQHFWTASLVQVPRCSQVLQMGGNCDSFDSAHIGSCSCFNVYM